MVTKKEFYFPSSDGHTRLHAAEWRPGGSVSAIVQIAHGVGEYVLRYEPFAAYLAEHGFIVIGNDHIGHGLSRSEDSAPLYFGSEDGWNHVAEDLFTLRNLAAARHPELPILLLGHSMGSFLARTYLIRHPGTVRAAILMGTGQPAPAAVAGGRAVARHEGRRLGYDHYSARVDRLSFRAYNRAFAPNRTDFDWLSTNPDNVDAHINDPLCGDPATIGLFQDMLGGIAFLTRRKNLRKMDMNTPVLFISGLDDPVGDMGQGVIRAYESFLRAGVQDADLKLYPGMRHEILFETDYKRVYTDLLMWIRRHM